MLDVEIHKRRKNKGKINGKWNIEELKPRVFEDYAQRQFNFIIEDTLVLTDLGYVPVKEIKIDGIHTIHTIDLENKLMYRNIKSLSVLPVKDKVVVEHCCNDGEYYFYNKSIFNPYGTDAILQRFSNQGIFKTTEFKYSGNLYDIKFEEPVFIVLQFNQGYCLFPV